MQATTMTNNTGAPVFYDNGDHHPQHGTLLGFWIYLMSDCLIFAVLFATYAVLGRSYAAGPSGADLFDLPLVALNTGFLLLSSITYGFAMIKMLGNKKSGTLAWLARLSMTDSSDFSWTSMLTSLDRARSAAASAAEIFSMRKCRGGPSGSSAIRENSAVICR